VLRDGRGIADMGKQIHVTMDIDGGLRLPDSLLDGALIENGHPLSATEARRRLRELRDQGFEVIPVCDHHDSRGYCLGHGEVDHVRSDRV
jgi:hypothetical protein